LVENKIPVLFIVDCLYEDAGGGSEKQFLKIHKERESIGIDPQIIFLRENDVHQRINWERSPTHVRLDSLFSGKVWKVIRKIEEVIREEKIAIVQSLFDDSSLVTAIIKARNPSIRFVCTQRNLGHSRGWLRRWIFRHVYRRADVVLANSFGIESVLRDQYAVPIEKIRVIDNMHDVPTLGSCERRAGSANAVQSIAPLIGVVVANLRPVKGVEEMIEACRRLPETSKIKMIVAGEGPERISYVNKTKEWGLLDRIEFIGYCADIPRLLERVDFAVLPSRAEGASNSLIEYLLAGLPVVATRVGGNSEFLGHGKYGLLIEPESPRALCDGLIEIEKSIEKWRKAAADGREAAIKRFSTATVASQYRRFYNSLIHME